MRAPPPDYESWPQDKKNEFCAAEAKAWRNATRGNGLGEQEATGEGVSLDDFNAYMPAHSYIFTPSREMWPAASVNARIFPVPLLNKKGEPMLDNAGNQKTISANAWLDKHKPVEQMTWAPGEPMLIPNRLISDGGWIERKSTTCFNRIRRPPVPQQGNPAEAGPWLTHVNNVFPDDAEHIIKWLAQRVRRPQEKINHALVLGGNQGIGKDTLLEPVKRAIGPWNFAEVSPQQMLGRFNGFLKSVILRVSEARDLGDVDRFQFYDHMKAYTAAPPDVLRVDEKYLREHAVLNCCGVIITSNHKADGIYLPPDDRRHFVAWSGDERALAAVVQPEERFFFEALALAVQEAPDRPVTNRDPPFAKLSCQTAQGDIGIPRNTGKQPGPVLSRYAKRPMPAHLAGRNTAGPALALRPFDDARNAHLKNRRHRMRALTGCNTPHRALAQIHRIGLRHRCRPPFGGQLESDSQPLGIPRRFNQEATCSRAMTGRVVKYSEPVPFHKAMPGAESVIIWKRGDGFTPAVARIAKPKNPTKAKARLAGNVAIDDEDGEVAEAKKGTTMTDYDISRGPYHAILDKMALARQAQTGESYAKAFTAVYCDPGNAALRDGAKYDDLAKSMDSIYGTSKSLVPAAKAAPPDPSQDYVSPGPAHDELDRLVMTRMKSDPKLSYQQSFTREYLLPANRSLKDRVDSESILRAQAREPAKPFPAYARG